MADPTLNFYRFSFNGFELDQDNGICINSCKPSITAKNPDAPVPGQDDNVDAPAYRDKARITLGGWIEPDPNAEDPWESVEARRDALEAALWTPYRVPFTRTRSTRNEVWQMKCVGFSWDDNPSDRFGVCPFQISLEGSPVPTRG